MRFFLELSYDGTDYAGWQRQPNVPTVQGAIEEAMSTLLKEEIRIIGCGRTDSGVHARHYIAHCDLDIVPEQCDHVIYKLNRLLAKDIACHRLISVKSNAHARYDAVGRTYRYDLHYCKSPFLGRYSSSIPDVKKADIDLLHEVGRIILETTDFTSFCKAHGGNTTMECRIMESYWTSFPGEGRLSYTVTANRFLRGMVRLLVGSSISVATMKLPLSELKSHMVTGTRSPLMKSAPPQGLALTKISYPYL